MADFESWFFFKSQKIFGQNNIFHTIEKLEIRNTT